jgi:dipeptidyl aminopeptidase/acylaminoacyl peptidase
MAQHVPDLDSLLRVPYVDPEYGFDLTPKGGGLVAFASNGTGQWEIYTMPLDGSRAPQQVTSGPGAKFAPRWSPDGHRLAYVLDLEGGELFDIWVYDLLQDVHTNLTPGTADTIRPHFAWSPAGDQISFLSDRSGRFETYVMPATGGEARCVFSLPRPQRDVQWAPVIPRSGPDGGWLAVEVEGVGQDYLTYLVPAGGGQAVPISQEDEPIPAKDACWSPDGRHLAFASDIEGFHNIGIYDLASGDIDWVTGGPGDKEHPDWSADGRRLAFVASEGPLTELAVLDLQTRDLARFRADLGMHHRPQFTPAAPGGPREGEHLVFVFDSPRHPPDLWRLSLEDGFCQQLTRSLAPGLETVPFIMPSLVHYPSLDGTDVPALLYRPQASQWAKDRLPPAVVYVHGGPNWLTQVTWDPLVQHMVGRGWIVLAPNYRGSTGYGRAWQLANRFDLGGGDTRDVVAGADYLAREGLADPGRIAVTGRSYGGYLTMTSLTQYPERWAGGSAVVPFLNWFTGHANSREDVQHWDLENLGDPEVDRDRYYERSPFFFLDQVEAPVQLICGAHDPYCPASESIQAKEALQALGKPCDLVLYEDEGHVFLKRENVVDAKKRQVAFLAGALGMN